MRIYQNSNQEKLESLFLRPNKEDGIIKERVRDIISKIKSKGDEAIFDLTFAIDKYNINPSNILVSEEEFSSAESILDKDFKEAVSLAKANIEKFHSAQLRKAIKISTMEGVELEQRRVAISKVGLYIPSGSSPLFSTVLMCAVPAKLAGCKEVVMCSPADGMGRIAPEILYTAKLCGIEKIYKLGGAIAVAAMAYGSESVTKVNKIFGPGNRYVTYAKQAISVDSVAIDMPAGPSEVMVLADSSAKAEFVAADLLSQLEHGPDSQAIAIVNSMDLATDIEKKVLEQMEDLDRETILNESLENCHIIVEEDIEKMVELANEYAAEHLIISLENADKVAYEIENAGSIFIGNYSPESVGDYASGTNHTLPTSGWAKTFSGVNIDTFSKYITYQKLSEDGLKNIAKTVITMAEHEGLKAHKNAVKIRL